LPSVNFFPFILIQLYPPPPPLSYFSLFHSSSSIITTSFYSIPCFSVFIFFCSIYCHSMHSYLPFTLFSLTSSTLFYWIPCLSIH
jgi:hypothetical protein